MEEINKEFKDLVYSRETLKIVEKAFSNSDKLIQPSKENIFRAFKLCPPSKTKVVIFGQDPYYKKGVADGLAFSTQEKATPASLQNIFKEIKRNYPKTNFYSNDLTCWAKQGVLLLNTCLTVEVNKPLSHKDIGWDYFVKNVISIFNKHSKNVIFVLWGNSSKRYKNLIDLSKHFVLESSHPSPLSANKGFFGNGHFLKINQILESINKDPIDWRT